MGEQGNEGADSQANLGCEYPEKPDPDWVALEAGVRKRLALAPGEGYKISQAAPAAAVAEPAPPIRPTTAAAEVSLEEMEVSTAVHGCVALLADDCCCYPRIWHSL